VAYYLDFLCGSEVVDVSRIKTVSIIRTTNRSDEELKRIQEKSRKEIAELNRNSRSLAESSVGLGRRNRSDCGGPDLVARLE
jgi:hypothetical protein